MSQLKEKTGAESAECKLRFATRTLKFSFLVFLIVRIIPSASPSLLIKIMLLKHSTIVD